MAEKLPVCDVHCADVLVVSIQDCDEGIANIKSLIQKKIDADGSKKHMILSFGVAAHRPGFDLETTAKNIKNFGVCPDERGNAPKDEAICASLDKTTCQNTDLPIELMVKKLQGRLGDGLKCKQSHSAGEYICNYMFYKGLDLANEINASNQEKDVRCKAIFCHVPSFETIPEP